MLVIGKTVEEAIAACSAHSVQDTSLPAELLPEDQPPNPPLQTSAKVDPRNIPGSDEEGHRLSKFLKVFHRESFQDVWDELLVAQPTTPGLFDAAKKLKTRELSAVARATVKVGRALGFDLKQNEPLREILVRHTGPGPNGSLWRHEACNIWIEKHTATSTDTPKAPFATVIHRAGLGQYQLDTLAAFRKMFLTILGTEVLFVYRDDLCKGMLVPRRSRSELLSSFLEHTSNPGPSILVDQAHYLHKKGDLQGVILILARALSFNPRVHEQEGVCFAIDHTRDWKAWIKVDEDTHKLELHIPDHKFTFESPPGQEGRRMMSDIFREVVEAYETEVKEEASHLSKRNAELNATRKMWVPSPNSDSAKLWRKNRFKKRTAKQKLLRKVAIIRNAHRYGTPPGEAEPKQSKAQSNTEENKDEEQTSQVESKDAKIKHEALLKLARETLFAETGQHPFNHETQFRAIRIALTDRRNSREKISFKHIHPRHRGKGNS
ncbi:hypothetical protein BDV96DRAFT_602782 [Lophiotrema nucula]|uniref:Uncharacterized protein n=1 Tax=Lophiotrema nucula TaxID=690887 RepID=A0A6A5YX63_9PLEO|nr:hypothetical protein BDV96DRAFT_602782 [Lophiotrema nucula]